jgi:hypothetical protein
LTAYDTTAPNSIFEFVAVAGERAAGSGRDAGVAEDAPGHHFGAEQLLDEAAVDPIFGEVVFVTDPAN